MLVYERIKQDNRGLPVRHNDKPNQSIVWTLGHSNKTLEQFIDKLLLYKIQLVVDVRTHPASRWLPHFNRRNLELILPRMEISYIFRGRNLGGLLENVNYAQTIDEVVELARTQRAVLMCSEGDYKKCHRFTMLTPNLVQKNLEVKHIIW